MTSAGPLSAPGTSGKPALEPWPERPARLGVRVAEQLIDAIVSGAYPPGTTLPIEPELCSIFRVSRSVIREVGKVLEGKGLVRVHQGQGTTVCHQDDWNLLDPQVLAATVRHDDTFVVIEQLVGIRATLEARMAFEAARHATQDELEEIRELVERMRTLQHDADQYFLLDGPYHDLIMKASRNRLGRSIVTGVQKEAYASRYYRGYPSVRHIKRTHLGHAAVLERLLARDAEGASDAMYTHIVTGWRARKKTIDTLHGT